MRHLGQRLVHATLLLVVVSFFSFVLVQLTPGDFFAALRMNPRVSAQTIDGLRSQYGLDEPIFTRYARWAQSVFRGDMGFSLAYGSPVAPLLWVRARNTFFLSSSATFLAWLLALPIGIWSAAGRGKWADRVCGLCTSTLLTIPDLILFLCLLLLAVRTGWFPAGGIVSPGADDLGFGEKVKDVVRHLFLPATGLALVTLPMLVRHVRSVMIEALESPFMLAARGHGIPGKRLLLRYALPAAANPLISLFGLSIATMLSASVLVEVVLSWPGLGPLLVEAILARDIYVVVGVVMLSSALSVAGNLLADVVLFLADPRIRME